MGIKIRISGNEIEARDYTVQESGTPLAAGDSRGGTGVISFSIPRPDPDRLHDSTRPIAKLLSIGMSALYGEKVEIVDSRRGFTIGTINGISENAGDGTYDISCDTRLFDLNIYNVQTKPFVGTLRAAFEYYLGLAGVKTDTFIEPTLGARQVAYPGWSGELWYHLKQMAVAQDADIALVSGIILMRPIRAREARFNRATTMGRQLGSSNLARAIEVYKYNNRPINGEMVWPPDDLTSEGQIFTVNAGESSEYALDFNASLSLIEQPRPQDWVGMYDIYSSVYSIISNDGIKVQAAQWTKFGGSVRVILNEDTRSARLIIRGARGMMLDGKEVTSFSLADFTDGDNGRRATLRILGTGVAFYKEKVTISTSVPASRTENEIGITIDNPFITSSNEMYRAGTRAAKSFAGLTPTLSADVVSVNKMGDSGIATYPTYGEVQASLKTTLGAAVKYSGVQTYYVTTNALGTYAKVKNYWFSTVRDDFTNQVFGNVAGARIFDKGSRRWYRVRDVTITDQNISVQADDDLTHADAKKYYATRKYSGVQAVFNGLSYQQAQWAGLYG